MSDGNINNINQSLRVSMSLLRSLHFHHSLLIGVIIFAWRNKFTVNFNHKPATVNTLNCIVLLEREKLDRHHIIITVCSILVNNSKILFMLPPATTIMTTLAYHLLAYHRFFSNTMVAINRVIVVAQPVDNFDSHRKSPPCLSRYPSRPLTSSRAQLFEKHCCKLK